MANVKIIEKKAAKVEAIKEKFQKAQSVIFFDYRGMTVEEANGLRNAMRTANVEYVVLKNAIVRRATASMGMDEEILPLLKGPTAFAFGYEDAAAPARILRDTIKKLKKCELKGGLVNGVVASQATVTMLADLPSRDQLLSRMLGSMLSPITGLAIVLDQIGKAKDTAPEAAAEQAPQAQASAE